MSAANIPDDAVAPIATERRGWRMRLGTNSRLFRHYFAVMALGTCSILVTAMALEMMRNYAEGLRIVERVQSIRAAAGVAHVASQIDAIRNQIREVADLPWGREGLGEADRRAEFHRLLKRVAAIIDISRYDAEGRETLYVSRVNEDRLKDPAAPRLAAGHLVAAGEAAFGAVEFRDALEPFVHVTMREGTFGDSGWVRALVDLKHVAEAISRLGQDGGTTYLVDTSGTVIAHPKVELMLRRTRVADPQILAYVRDQSPGKPTRAGLRTTALDGADVYSSVASIGMPAWSVVIEQPVEVINAPLRRWFLGMMVTLAVALLMSFVVSLWYARRLSKPILALEAGAVAFGQGNFGKHIQVRTGDEIELLAAQFNRMADQLQEYTDGLERRVAEKTLELETANRHKSEFLANMSHELRTPLNAVIGFSEVLKERMFGELNDKQMEYVRDIYGSGQHLLSLINDILDLSKIEAGRMELDIHEFDVRAAVANCCTLIRDRAQRQKLKLESSVDAEVSRWPADERKFKQILLNLMSNAVKFTSPGGVVTVRVRIEDNWLVMSVTDTGIGIAAEDRAAIFEEFRQLHGPGEAKHEGTGLGLSLSRRLVELHGGRITVESVAGKGSTFTARFPGAPRSARHG